MEEADALARVPKRSVGRKLAGLFHGRPRLQAGALLAGPVGWLVVGYLGSLAIMLAAAFWSVDELSSEVVQGFSLANFKTLLDESVYQSVAGRTLLIAALVTLTDMVIAFPIALYMAKLANPRVKGLLVVAVLMPLWSGYLIKVGAWRTMLSEDGVVNWALDPFGLKGPGYGNTAVWLVESYLWLPYMIIPIFAGLERIPDSVLNASGDLGARPLATIRRVIFPLVLPAAVAGSIFTFSLTLGDYITPGQVSNNQFIGQVVYDNISNDLPLASAFATVPILIMIAYLFAARRMGAFEHL